MRRTFQIHGTRRAYFGVIDHAYLPRAETSSAVADEKLSVLAFVFDYPLRAFDIDVCGLCLLRDVVFDASGVICYVRLRGSAVFGAQLRRRRAFMAGWCSSPFGETKPRTEAYKSKNDDTEDT